MIFRVLIGAFLAAFALASGAGAGSIGPIEVVPAVETAPVPNGGDAADDPAIWIHPTDASQSTIIGTDKKGGIAVYDLAGRQLQYRPDGELNNVDLRSGFRLGRRTVALVTAGNRSDDSLAIYRVDAGTRKLVSVAARKIEPGIAPYGSCMYRSRATGRLYVFVTSKSGEVEQWRLFDNGTGRVDGKKVRTFSVGSQSEGCVADDGLGRLYVGEESEGIWRYGAEPTAGSRRTKVDSAGSGGHLEADVEGLAIAYGPNGSGYLVASSQGSSSFVLYRREGANAYVKTFAIGEGSGIDAVEDTDGIDVTVTDLGSSFPRGVFVAQDGKNEGENQNYKLVRWESIVAGG